MEYKVGDIILWMDYELAVVTAVKESPLRIDLRALEATSTPEWYWIVSYSNAAWVKYLRPITPLERAIYGV